MDHGDREAAQSAEENKPFKQPCWNKPFHLPPEDHTSLLVGFPGREISGARTNPRAWNSDCITPDLIPYPHNASTVDFYEHPVGTLAGLSRSRLAELGLIQPEELNNSDSCCEFDTDFEEQESDLSSESAKRASSRSASASVSSSGTDVLHKVKSWARFRSSSKPTGSPFNQENRQTPSPQTPDLPERPSSSFRLRSVRSISALRAKQTLPRHWTIRSDGTKGVDKTRISRPLDCTSSLSVTRPAWGSFSSSNSASRSSASSPDQNKLFDVLEDEAYTHTPPRSPLPGPLLDNSDEPTTFRLAAPRLSPMEYARHYLISKSIAEREGRECEVERPEYRSFYTPNHERFFILPKIPSSVPRHFKPLRAPQMIGRTDLGVYEDQQQGHCDNSGQYADEYSYERDSYTSSELSGVEMVLAGNSSQPSPLDAPSREEPSLLRATMSQETISSQDMEKNQDDMPDDASIRSGDSNITSFHRGEPVRLSGSQRDATPRSSANMPSPNEVLAIHQVSPTQEPTQQDYFTFGSSPPVSSASNDQEASPSNDQIALVRSTRISDQRSGTSTPDTTQIPKIWRAAADWGPPPTPPPNRPLPPLPTVRRHSPLRMSIILPRLPEPEHMVTFAPRTNLISAVG